MINQTENRIGYSGTIFLIVLFLLIFSDNSHNSNDSDNYLRAHYQLSGGTTPAVASNDIRPLIYLQIIVSVYAEMNNLHSNRLLSIESDTRLINQRIVSLHKVELKIKPLQQGFNYPHQFSSDEDIPVLS